MYTENTAAELRASRWLLVLLPDARFAFAGLPSSGCVISPDYMKRGHPGSMTLL